MTSSSALPRPRPRAPRAGRRRHVTARRPCAEWKGEGLHPGPGARSRWRSHPHGARRAVTLCSTSVVPSHHMKQGYRSKILLCKNLAVGHPGHPNCHSESQRYTSTPSFEALMNRLSLAQAVLAAAVMGTLAACSGDSAGPASSARVAFEISKIII